MEIKKLPKGAYGGVAGKDYTPYVSEGSKLGSNATVLVIGVILAIIFAASTAYSGMKAGLTVAAGIPGSIIGSVFVAMFAKQKGILGKNITQAMASGGEAVPGGIIFVLPAVLLIGSQISFIEGFFVGFAGVLVGIGVSSLVYNYLIIEEHGKLSYPESMAISETLVASDAGGDSIKFMGIGFGIAGVITVLTGSFFNAVNNVISFVNNSFYKCKFELEVNPLLLGIGFIVGLETALTMFAGSIFANFGIVPLIGYFSSLAGEGANAWNNANVSIASMGVNEISGNYVKYIGAGMMLCGGIIGALRLIPTIISSVKETLNAKSSGTKQEGSNIMNLIIFGSVILTFVAGFIISGNFLMACVGSILCLILAALFVIVSGRLTGTIGTSSLPVSGMTIACLVIVTLVFVAMGWTNQADLKSLLLFGTFMVVAISIAGGYNQSMKVNWIIGGSKQELTNCYVIASFIGVVTTIGIIILLSDQLAITGDNPPFAMPQANLIATLTHGTISGQLPWVMVIVGIAIAIVMFFLNLPIMTVAIGFYLPIATTSIILVGALIRFVLEKSTKDEKELEAKISNGVSLSSGLVAGGSIVGLIGIVLQVSGVITPMSATGFAATNAMAILLLSALVIFSAIPIFRSKLKTTSQE